MNKVLIVDKDEETYNQLDLVDWKSLNVTQIERCSGYNEAVSFGCKFKPNIVISGVKLDDGWGYNLINIFHSANIESSFIMISKYEDYNYVRKSLLFGAQDYIIKPIDITKIENIIAKINSDKLSYTVNNFLKISSSIDPITRRAYKSYSCITLKCLNTLKQEYNKHISLKYIADKYVMNSKYIGMQFLHDTGLHFTDYRFILQMIIAKQLIITTDYKIQDIALQVGFIYPNHFFSAFKMFYGESPNEVRKTNYFNKLGT
ncbi:helix-turn-helix domain-containing protein [Paludicola sp. MB14-C6]|uniref:response regulator transcription factor n=1 Tax=Paludihabitans sp. MB14-C6 TaxID=3070656 RepID=UPI0027DC273A|nr:helix-turn-helix domain-containing protein [Paludicola sp. MB14-C6]WMJ22826.1 helix-turn-helix domain-containing protein [Paludicola sp. MB14-C6]